MNLEELKKQANIKYPYIDWLPESYDEQLVGRFYIFFSENLYVTILEDLTVSQEKIIAEILEKLRNV